MRSDKSDGKCYANLFKQTVTRIDMKLDSNRFRWIWNFDKKRSISTVNIRKSARFLSSISIFDRVQSSFFLFSFFFTFVKKCRFFTTIHDSLFFPLLWSYSKKWYVFSIYGDNKKKSWFDGREIFYQFFFFFFVFLSFPLIFPSNFSIFISYFVDYFRDYILFVIIFGKLSKLWGSYSRHIEYLDKSFNCLKILIEIFFSNEDLSFYRFCQW